MTSEASRMAMGSEADHLTRLKTHVGVLTTINKTGTKPQPSNINDTRLRVLGEFVEFRLIRLLNRFEHPVLDAHRHTRVHFVARDVDDVGVWVSVLPVPLSLPPPCPIVPATATVREVGGEGDK